MLEGDVRVFVGGGGVVGKGVGGGVFNNATFTWKSTELAIKLNTQHHSQCISLYTHNLKDHAYDK